MKKLWKDSGWNESSGYPPIVLMKWKGTNEQRQGLRERYLAEGTASFLAGGDSSPNAAAAVNIIDNVGKADGQAGARPDGAGAGGNEGAPVRPSDYTRGLAKAAFELQSLSPLELQNLGLLTAKQVKEAQEQVESQPVFLRSRSIRTRPRLK